LTIFILPVYLFYLSPQLLGCLWNPDRSHQTDTLKKIFSFQCFLQYTVEHNQGSHHMDCMAGLSTIERPRYAYARHSRINENHH